MKARILLLPALGGLLLLLNSCIDGGYYDYQGSYSNHHRPITHYPGHSLSALPYGYTKIYVGSTPYWHHGNRWYRYNSGRYIACSRPHGYRGHTSYTRYSNYRYTTPRYHYTRPTYGYRSSNYYRGSNHHYKYRNHSSNRYKNHSYNRNSSHDRGHHSNRDSDRRRTDSDRSPRKRDNPGSRGDRTRNRNHSDPVTRRNPRGERED